MTDLWIIINLLIHRHKDLKDPKTNQYGQDVIIGEGLDALQKWYEDHGDELI